MDACWASGQNADSGQRGSPPPGAAGHARPAREDAAALTARAGQPIQSLHLCATPARRNGQVARQAEVHQPGFSTIHCRRIRSPHVLKKAASGRLLSWQVSACERANPAEPETHSRDEGNWSVWVQPCGNPGTHHGSISRRRQPHADRGDRNPCLPSKQPDAPRSHRSKRLRCSHGASAFPRKTGSATFRRPFRSREKRRQPRRAALFTPREGELISRSACCRTSGTRRSWRSARRRRPGSG